MRDPSRMDKVLAAFKEIWKEAPDWRFMQLICNMQRSQGSDMFFVEDDVLIEYLQKETERAKSNAKSI